MALTVVTFASYLTTITRAWRGEDYDASKFIKAIKGDEPVNGYAHVPVRGNRVRFVQSNRTVTHTCFGQMAADYLVQTGLTSQHHVNLVPVPSSDAVNGTAFTRFPARDLAQALQSELASKGVVVYIADILRWQTAKPPSHAGGTRDPFELYNNLVLTTAPARGMPCVLVDDVCTGGGHLRASKRRLTEAGANVIYGVCAGRSVQTQPNAAFAINTEQFDDLVDMPWDF